MAHKEKKPLLLLRLWMFMGGWRFGTGDGTHMTERRVIVVRGKWVPIYRLSEDAIDNILN